MPPSPLVEPLETRRPRRDRLAAGAPRPRPRGRRRALRAAATEPTGSVATAASTSRAASPSCVDCHLAQGDLTRRRRSGRGSAPPRAARAAGGGRRPPRARRARGGRRRARAGRRALPRRGSAAAATPATRLDVPWRAAAALALLRVGRRREALDLAREQHSRPRPRPALRRRPALRTLAATDADADPDRAAARGAAPARDVTPTGCAAQIDTDLAGLLRARPASDDRGAALLRAPRPTPAARSCGRCRAGSAACSSGSASRPRPVRAEAARRPHRRPSGGSRCSPSRG